MPFNQSLLNSLKKQPAKTTAAAGLPVPVLVGGAVLLALLVTVLVLLLRRRPQTAELPFEEDPALGTNLAAALADDGVDPLGMALATAQANRDKVQGALRQRPEEVARVIRVWLSQDE